MALQFVIGRAGTGKTSYCLQQIFRQAEQMPLGAPLIMLVPEQATFQTDVALIQGNGVGTVRAQALSFRRLEFRVMQETGGTALIPISENGKNMLLYKIVHRLKNELHIYRGGEEKHGFIERLGDLLTEWKRYGIEELDLDHLIHADYTLKNEDLIQRKLHDLQLIQHELTQQLAGHYIDSEDYLSWLEQGFHLAPSMQGAQVWVDGFHGFTPKEIDALAAILRANVDVTVTLTLDDVYDDGREPHELHLFRSTAETYIKLREMAQQQGIDIKRPITLPQQGGHTRFSHAPLLAYLEGHYAEQVALPYVRKHDAKQAEIRLNEATHRRAEVEAVARDIVKQVREKGMRYRDIAIMMRDQGTYHDYLQVVFRDYNIPFFMDEKQKATHHPFAEFIRSALDIAVRGWHYETVIRCVKTDFFTPLDDSFVTRDTYDLLENYVLATGIDNYRWYNDEWRPLHMSAFEQQTDKISEADDLLFQAIVAARQTFVPHLRHLTSMLNKAKTIQQMCKALYDFIVEVQASERLERWSQQAMEQGDVRRAREYRQLWDGVMQILDQLVEMVGEEDLSVELFAGMIEVGLDSLKLASVPPTLDQVLIGHVDRTRPGQIKACYLIGINEGVLPQTIAEDGLLTEDERFWLAKRGLTMAPTAQRKLLEERFIIYNALTVASEQLWLSWSMANEEGKSLHPSEVIGQLQRLFPQLAKNDIVMDPYTQMSVDGQLQFVAHRERTLSTLITQLRQWKSGHTIDELWWEVYNYYALRPEHQQQLQKYVESLDFSNDVSHLSPYVSERLYGQIVRGSVSRMERFASCPFQHFVVHGLRLKERRIYRLARPEIGQLFHEALYRLTKQQQNFGELSDMQIREAVHDIMEQLKPQFQAQILLSSDRYRYMARKLRDIVAQTALILKEHANRSNFRPVGLELAFGPGETIPAWTISLQDGKSIQMSGRIDRVDVADTEDGALLRVIDYKSSSKNLEIDEIAYGIAMQMMTYLDVLLQAAPVWLHKEAKPAGAFYFHVKNPTITAAHALPAEKVQSERLKKFKLKGLVLADEQVVRMMDQQLESGASELLPVNFEKSGHFNPKYRSSIATSEQWETLLRSVRERLRSIGQRIVDGDVSINPYKLGTKTPCQYCTFHAVCQIDPLMNADCFTKLPVVDKSEKWNLFSDIEGDEDHE